MAIMGSVVFIHPLDMGRLLKHDPYILDIFRCLSEAQCLIERMPLFN